MAENGRALAYGADLITTSVRDFEGWLRASVRKAKDGSHLTLAAG